MIVPACQAARLQFTMVITCHPSAVAAAWDLRLTFCPATCPRVNILVVGYVIYRLQRLLPQTVLGWDGTTPPYLASQRTALTLTGRMRCCAYVTLPRVPPRAGLFVAAIPAVGRCLAPHCRPTLPALACLAGDDVTDSATPAADPYGWRIRTGQFGWAFRYYNASLTLPRLTQRPAGDGIDSACPPRLAVPEPPLLTRLACDIASRLPTSLPCLLPVGWIAVVALLTRPYPLLVARALPAYGCLAYRPALACRPTPSLYYPGRITRSFCRALTASPQQRAPRALASQRWVPPVLFLLATPRAGPGCLLMRWLVLLIVAVVALPGSPRTCATLAPPRQPCLQRRRLTRRLRFVRRCQLRWLTCLMPGGRTQTLYTRAARPLLPSSAPALPLPLDLFVDY